MALRGLLSVAAAEGTTPGVATPDSVVDQAPWNYTRAGFGLLRRGSGFSIASVASNLPGLQKGIVGTVSARPRGLSVPNPDEAGQPLVEVISRPGSVREVAGEDEDGSDGSEESSSENGGEEEETGSESDHDDPNAIGGRSDARSMRSFSSMMSGESRDKRRAAASAAMAERKSLSDRLANVSVLSRLGKDSTTSSLRAVSLSNISSLPSVDDAL